jgi:type I restriction enzyme M protein
MFFKELSMTERLSQSELESYLWGAAVILRGLVNAGCVREVWKLNGL